MKWSGVGTASRPVGVPLQPGQLTGCRRLSAAGLLVEAAGPVEAAVGLTPVDRPQVVHDVAAADDQHAAFAQRGELGAEVEVVLERLAGVDRQLHDRDVGVRA